MEGWLRDLRFGARALLRRPAVSGLAVLSLALGIGANATIFSLVNALFLRALPVADPGTLVAIFGTDRANPGLAPVSHLNWLDLRAQSGDVFASVTAYDWTPLAISVRGGEATVGFGQMVSGEYFETLGLQPFLGRLLARSDDTTPGAHPVVVLSHGTWTRKFGGRATVIGERIVVNATPFEVVGVAPPGFTGATLGLEPDLWAPMAMNAALRRDENWYGQRRGLSLSPVARLRPGVDLATARAALQTLGSRLEQAHPADNQGRSLTLLPFQQATIFPGLRDAAVAGTAMLMAITGLVLLIACANVANLLLARASARERETAVRLALGAGRGALVRQLLAESLLLAFAGALLGLLVARWSGNALLAFVSGLPAQVTLSLDLGLDPRVLAFTLGVAVLTAVLAGLAPAWQVARPELVTTLKDRGTGETRGGRLGSARHLLVGAQVALSLVALVGAGLFTRSLDAAQRVDPGFDSERLGLVSFDLGLQGYDRERGLVFLRTVLERVGAIPGVARATLAHAGPLQGSLARSVFPEGQEGERGVLVQVNGVTAGYFETVGVPLLRGRALGADDRAGSPPVVVVNEAMAARFWPGQEALGKRFRFFGEESLVEIVGVARNAKYNTLGEQPQPYVYRPLEQDYRGALTLIVRAAGEPGPLLPALRAELVALQREMPLVGLTTAGQALRDSLWASRLAASLLAVFGALALVLASVGLYGVMSYAVGQRAREIGVRMTLGAGRAAVMAMVFRQGLAVVGVGLAFGAIAALALSRLVAALLFVSPSDPLVHAGMAMTLAAVGALAILVPALRATAVDPVIALRAE